MDWARLIAIYRHSLSSLRMLRTPVHKRGEATSYPAVIREHNSCPGTTPSPTSNLVSHHPVCRSWNFSSCDKPMRDIWNHELMRTHSKLAFARFETAFGMQREAPEALDLSCETASTLKTFGLEPGQTTGFGWQCLVARRLAERGVRFIELIDVGSSNNWDAHGDMATHAPLAKNVDQPIAALITDLKQRGMLDDTLVVWTTEFGRTPYHEKADHPGREHHHQVFSSWLAGGGVKSGITYGSSDEFGIAIAGNRVHVHDFHATILHLLGLNHEQLTYRHAGRDYRLTDVHGHIVKDLLA